MTDASPKIHQDPLWAYAHLRQHPQELANPRSCQSLFDCLRVIMESTGRHGQDSVVESIHFSWFFHVQHQQDPAIHAWLPQAPQCAPRALPLQPHWTPHWRSRVCALARSRARYHEGARCQWFFFESMEHITFNVFSCLLFVDSETPSEWLWLWLSPAVSRLSFPLSIHTHTRIHVVTIVVYYIFWYWQNRHRPEFRLKRLLVPVTTQSWLVIHTGKLQPVLIWREKPVLLALLSNLGIPVPASYPVFRTKWREISWVIFSSTIF